MQMNSAPIKNAATDHVESRLFSRAQILYARRVHSKRWIFVFMLKHLNLHPEQFVRVNTCYE